MDAMFDYGDKVRVIRNIRNDGTFMGTMRGDLLIRRGSIGYIKGSGKFLGDQVIYQVHFIDHGRTVGCRDNEVIAIDAPWTERLFERGDNVITQKSLSSAGQIVVNAGDCGTILGLESNQPPLFYRVTFERVNGGEANSWLIPETILTLDETKPSTVAIEVGRL